MTRFPTRAVFLSLLAAITASMAACSDTVEPPTPSDLGVDAPSTDGGPTDATVPDDAASPDDASVPDDASAPDDADSPDDASVPDDAGGDGGSATDAGPAPVCRPELGATCSGTLPCAAEYECSNGRCVPQTRAICGGWAGATCPGTGGGPATECLYFAGGSDYGPCFTPDERACICARAVSGFVCP